MTNATAGHAKRLGALAALKAILRQFSPPFQAVYIGEPLGIPVGIDYAAALWFVGESEKTKTMANVMVTTQLRLRVYWRPRLAPADREALELAVWDCCRDLQSAIRLDSQLGGNVSDLEISLAEGNGWAAVGPLDQTGEPTRYRVLTFDVELWELEAEEYTP